MSGLQLMGSGRADRVRRRYDVFGLVQGVGFRPFVYVTASELGLAGSVSNTPSGVVVEVEGAPDDVDAFGRRLRRGRAAAGRGRGRARVGARRCAAAPASRSRTRAGGAGRTLASPDVAVCDDCLRRAGRPGRPPLPAPVHHLHQLRSAVHDHHRPALRPGRHHDGRLRDVRRLPRGVRRPGRPALPRPADRLPRLRSHRSSWSPPAVHETGDDAVRRARDLLADGRVVAVKGLGGYHLACDARNEHGGRRAAAAQAARRQAVRGDGPRPRRRRGAGVDGRRRAAAAHRDPQARRAAPRAESSAAAGSPPNGLTARWRRRWRRATPTSA